MNHFQTCTHCGGGYWNKHVEQRFCAISCGNRKRAGESSLKAHKRRVEAKLASEPSRHGETLPVLEHDSNPLVSGPLERAATPS